MKTLFTELRQLLEQGKEAVLVTRIPSGIHSPGRVLSVWRCRNCSHKIQNLEGVLFLVCDQPGIQAVYNPEDFKRGMPS